MSKYLKYPTVDLPNRKWPNASIEKAPIWCSVDLRDGNQALATPMCLNEKLDFFKLLVDIGFKEIEVGFPSASQIEYDFLRHLIDNNLVPDDVYLQILTQAREELIDKSFESLAGAKKAIIHLYNSTSEQQRRITFKKSKEEIKAIALHGVDLILARLNLLPNTEVLLEYSPESFTGTELDYALEVCEAVVERWRTKQTSPVIINLPSTVEMSTPNVFADRVEWFLENFSNRDNIILSVHPHNDRGCAVATAELALLAGADRIEGTLFGNGERTGNLDIVTTGLNMYTQGVNPELDLFNVPALSESYQKFTKMDIPPRQPYAGELVFTAFSGSHQDAIKKGMDLLAEKNENDSVWDVPYLPINPKDIGRSYEAIIRINSQSGKGGIAYVMEKEYSLIIPKNMQPQLREVVQQYSDKVVHELSPKEIHDILRKEFIDLEQPYKLLNYKLQTDTVTGEVIFVGELQISQTSISISGSGTGAMDAFINSLASVITSNLEVVEYHEQALNSGTNAVAVTFLALKIDEEDICWAGGYGIDSSHVNFTAILNCINRRSTNN
ncbi:MAG: 2-isopropylmalate synthase [Spirochaetales bacterium]|nr:2-isopropylmalate synthase [Spirochaetales bacterium]